MCLAIPVRIIDVIDTERAVADAGGARREIGIALLEGEVRPGDWVLVHVGYALERIDEDEALRTLDDLRAMQMLEDESHP